MNAVVLVVDDHRINNLVTAKRLEKHGYDVLVAMDGEEAVSLCAQQAVDLVLMDVSMPIMDGLEATRRIRALSHPRMREVPILAFTAHSQRELVERCLTDGMNEVLVKPVPYDDLVGRVDAWLARTRAGTG